MFYFDAKKFQSLLVLVFLFTSVSVNAQYILVDEPNGNEVWSAGETYTIEWDTNLGGSVNIQLIDNGQWHSEITNSTFAANESYQWTIDQGIEYSNDYQVEIRSNQNNDIVDWSDYAFTIEEIEWAIHLESPDGNEVWRANQNYQIEWETNLGGSVNIQLIEDGLWHSVISHSVPAGDEQYDWDIDPEIQYGTEFQVEIRSNEYNDVVDWSDDEFTILGAIEVEEPNGGEIWTAGETYLIEWNTNLGGSVNIQLIENDQWHSEITNSTSAGTESFAWTINPEIALSDEYQIEIRSNQNDDIVDWSDNTFTIEETEWELQVVSPDGNEVWRANQDFLIEWDTNLTGTLNIQLIEDGQWHSVISNSIAAENEQYTWNVDPEIQYGSEFQVEIRSNEFDDVVDWSDDEFTIRGAIEVEEPNGGEIWTAGETYTIEWDTNLGGNVNIQLIDNNQGHSEIVDSTPAANGSYQWTIDPNIEFSNGYQIEIRSNQNEDIVDWSDYTFTIEEINWGLQVVSPNGGEVWQAGNTYPIAWETNLLGDVNIKLIENGLTHSEIINSTPASSQLFNWHIPADILGGNNFQIEIRSTEYINIADWSNDNFIIQGEQPFINIQVPDLSDVVATKEWVHIQWESNIQDMLDILLVSNNIEYPIVSIDNTFIESYWFYVPQWLSDSNEFQIRIRSQEFGVHSDSDVFEIDNNNNFSENFIYSENEDIYLNGNEYTYSGFNCYYLYHIENEGHHDDVVDIFQRCKNDYGIDVIRTWGFDDGGSLHPQPDSFPEQAWIALDNVIAAATDEDVRLIIPFVNYWEHYGGMMTYVNWFDDPSHSTIEAFYYNYEIKEWFKEYISFMLNRVNTVTNIAYKDDPTIFAWQLANEPRCSNLELLHNWSTEIIDHIHTIDTNHLVTLGSEGNYNGNGTRGLGFFEDLYSLVHYDFCTQHIYIEENRLDIDTPIDLINEANQWLVSSNNLGRALIVDEFGFSYDYDYSGNYTRNNFFEAIYYDIFPSGISGSNAWVFFLNGYENWDSESYGIFPYDTDILEMIQSTNEIETQDYKLPSAISTHVSPNPFNSTINIKIDLPQRLHLNVELYNISGQKVATLSTGYKEAGKTLLNYNASQLSSGIYFLKVSASGYGSQLHKAILIK